MLHEEIISTVHSEENVRTQFGLNFSPAEADAIRSQDRQGLVVRREASSSLKWPRHRICHGNPLLFAPTHADMAVGHARITRLPAPHNRLRGETKESERCALGYDAAGTRTLKHAFLRAASAMHHISLLASVCVNTAIRTLPPHGTPCMVAYLMTESLLVDDYPCASWLITEHAASGWNVFERLLVVHGKSYKQ
jgi:hypothetical protein